MAKKTVRIELVDEFEVGQDVYEAFKDYMADALKYGDISVFDFHVIEDGTELPNDGVLK